MQVTYHEDAQTDDALLLARMAPRVSPEAVARACELIGDRWSLPIIAALLERPLRYTEIQELLPGLAPNILSGRLRSLERDGLISAERYSARPPRFQYRLTADGVALREVALMLSAWSERGAGSRPADADVRAANADTGAGDAGTPGAAGERTALHAGAVHEQCGGPLELRWWCATCGPAEPGEEQSIHA